MSWPSQCEQPMVVASKFSQWTEFPSPKEVCHSVEKMAICGVQCRDCRVNGAGLKIPPIPWFPPILFTEQFEDVIWRLVVLKKGSLSVDTWLVLGAQKIMHPLQLFSMHVPVHSATTKNQTTVPSKFPIMPSIYFSMNWSCWTTASVTWFGRSYWVQVLGYFKKMQISSPVDETVEKPVVIWVCLQLVTDMIIFLGLLGYEVIGGGGGGSHECV